MWSAVLRGPLGFERQVALKLLRGAGTLEDLAQEARLGARFHHPNLVSIHELGEDGDRWFVAMERVDGPSLQSLLGRAPLPADAVIEIGVQTCAALDVIHRGGVVHRDIKPSNLLIDRSGLLKVVDLGLSSLLGGPGRPAGTPGYCPPEQQRGQSDLRSDLFSLGVTLFRLATGERALPPGRPGLAAAHLLDEQRERLTTLCDAHRPGLGSVLIGCLHPDPNARWDSARSLSDALRQLSTGGYPLQGLLPSQEAPARPVMPTGPTPARPPVFSDRFVGRHEERARLAGELASSSLVTVHGPGGVGKTRLAREVVRSEERVWWIDVPDVPDGWLLRLAEVLRSASDPQRIGAALAARGPLLIVLDGAEVQLGSVADTLARWVDQAPEARFLCTSRALTRVPGERVLTLSGLELRDGVELFIDRCPTPPRDEPAVARIVRELDVQPLAIELTAARTRWMALPEVERRLDRQLRLLVGDDRGRPVRQRSLRASLDASFALLAPVEREAMAQLSVFAGPFEPGSAEEVLELGPDAPWAIDVLSRLADASALTVDGRCFRMPKVIREYASELLPDRHAAEARHARHFARLASMGTLRPDQRAELVAAARRARLRDDPLAVPLTIALADLCLVSGGVTAALEAVEAVEALTSPADRANLRARHGELLVLGGRRSDARPALEEALALAQAAGDTRLEVRVRGALIGVYRWTEPERAIATGTRALELLDPRTDLSHSGTLNHQLANVWTDRDPAQAEAALHRAVAAYRSGGNPVGQALVMLDLALLGEQRGVSPAAAYEFAEAAFRGAGHARALAFLLLRRASSAFITAPTRSARQLLEESLAAHVALGESRLVSTIHANLGHWHLRFGDWRDAATAADAAIAVAHRTDDRASAGSAAGCRALVTAATDPEAALPAMEQALALIGQAPAFEAALLVGYGEILAALGRADAPEVFRRAEAAARALRQQSVALLALDGLGRWALDAGRPDEARPALDQAVELARRIGARSAEATALGAQAALDRDPALAGRALALAVAHGGPRHQAFVGSVARALDPTAALPPIDPARLAPGWPETRRWA